MVGVGVGFRGWLLMCVHSTACMLQSEDTQCAALHELESGSLAALEAHHQGQAGQPASLTFQRFSPLHLPSCATMPGFLPGF